MKFRVLIGFAGLALAAGSPAQDQTDKQAPAMIRTESRVVLVDAVVTDKKGNYIADLDRKDFKVFEDGKEQTLKSFSFEASPSSPTAGQKHYLVLFFDNSHMDSGGQIRARQAAAKFIDANAGENRLMAVVNYSGTLSVAQSFTSDADRLRQVVSGVKFSVGPSFGNYGTRNSLLALTSMAKSLEDVPGRKILVLLTGGFPVTGELLSDITAAIAMCNRSNVAVYPLDVGGLASGVPDISEPGRGSRGNPGTLPRGLNVFGSPRVMMAAFQRPPGGSGGGTPSGGGSAPSGGGTRGGGSTGAGGTPTPSRPVSSPGSPGKPASPGTGTTTTGRGNTGGMTNPNNAMNGQNTRNVIMPPLPPFTSANQQALYMLADGTGGFVIVNTNDLVGGMERILKEQDQFYLLSYTPPESAEGLCHALKVKVDRGGTVVRARTGYCNIRPADLLAGKPAEKSLEALAEGAKPGAIVPRVALPFFFTGADTARVNVAVEMPTDAVKFEKLKGKQHAEVNILGIAYREDGSVGARFSDTVKLDLEDKRAVEEFRKTPLHYDTQFDVASGKYNLKLVLAPAGSQEFAKIERPLAVEPFDGKKFAMSTVALSLHATAVSDTETGLDALLTEGRTPLVADNHQFTPTGESRFKSSDKVFLYVEVYEPANAAAEPPRMGVKIAIFDNKTGKQLIEGTVEATRLAVAGNPMVAVPMQIPVAQLGAGAYRCEFTALDTLGNTAKRSMEIEVE